ncbi:MAG: hypothetical protein O7G32_15045 [SAR324 cluster bacterium]|nr:hypothetical protein [SAR324 cluster bacterium]
MKSDAADTGTGAELGWEGEGGLTFAVRMDRVTLKNSNGNETEVEALRAHIGYRF